MTPSTPKGSLTPNNLLLLPPALAKALTDFAAITRQDRIILVMRRGASTTILPVPDGDPHEVYDALTDALTIATAQMAHHRVPDPQPPLSSDEDGEAEHGD
jgi:hypothetical protein